MTERDDHEGFTRRSERRGSLPRGGIETLTARSSKEVDLMARIIVTTEQSERPDAPVLLDERVCPEHLSDHHSAAQLIERLGWAINDAEKTEPAARAL
jgi:hypothetical protein